jgi:hypothetical protein
MKAAAAKYGSVSERLAGPITRAQALRLRASPPTPISPSDTRLT